MLPCLSFSSASITLMGGIFSLPDRLDRRLDQISQTINSTIRVILQTVVRQTKTAIYKARNVALATSGYNPLEIAAINCGCTMYIRDTLVKILKYAPFSMGVASAASVTSSSSTQAALLLLTGFSVTRICIRYCVRSGPRASRGPLSIILISPFFTGLAFKLSSGSWLECLKAYFVLGSVMSSSAMSLPLHNQGWGYPEGQALVQSGMFSEMLRQVVRLKTSSSPIQLIATGVTAVTSFILLSRIEKPYARQDRAAFESYSKRYSPKHIAELTIQGSTPLLTAKLLGAGSLGITAAILSILAPSTFQGVRDSHQYCLNELIPCGRLLTRPIFSCMDLYQSEEPVSFRHSYQLLADYFPVKDQNTAILALIILQYAQQTKDEIEARNSSMCRIVHARFPPYKHEKTTAANAT